MTLQQVIAAIGFALCLGLLAHHFVGARRQARLRLWGQARMWQLRQWANKLRQGRRGRGAGPDQAAREAADVIERARRRDRRGPNGNGNGSDKAADKGASRGDNVVRPPRFGNRRNDLH